MPLGFGYHCGWNEWLRKGLESYVYLAYGTSRWHGLSWSEIFYPNKGGMDLPFYNIKSGPMRSVRKKSNKKWKG